MRASRVTSVGAALLWVSACNPRPSPPPGQRSPEPKVDVGGGTSPHPEPIPGDRPVQIEAGPSHFCVRLHSGRVACWGDNQGGRLGDGTVLSADAPVLVRGVDDADRLFVGAACAHTKGAGTLCWAGVDACPDCDEVAGTRLRHVPDAVAGAQAIGVPPTPCFVTAAGGLQCPGAEQAPPAGLPPLRAVHQGHDFVCGVDRGDRLQCYWRTDGARFDPGLPTSAGVTAGPFHLCVIDDERRAYCWGNLVRSGYAAPQPGQPRDEYGPVAEIEGLRARSIAAGHGHTCAITVQEEVVCWGRRSYRAPGADVLGRWTIELPRVAALAVGYDTACGLVDTGEVHCWSLIDDATDPRRPRPISGLPVPDGTGHPPPRDTGPRLREALRWADAPRRLADIAALERGLVLGAVREGRWQPSRTACFAEHLLDTDLRPQVQGQWSCDATLSRCVAQRESDATVFRWADDGRGGRALQAIIDYEGTAATSEPATVETELTDDPRGCGLWRRLWNRDEALVGDSVVVLHHPDNDLGETPGPPIRRLCGEDARRAAMASMTVDPLAEDWRCNGLECSYSMGQWARGVFVFRRDGSGQPKLWIVGDDFEGDEPSIPPLTSRVTREVRGHGCP
jgi:hypothetical protein